MAEQDDLISFLVQVRLQLPAAQEKHAETLYVELERAGLYRKHRNGAGDMDTLPAGVVMGVFTGYNSVDVCAFVRNAVILVLQNLKLKAEISIIAGEKAAWVVLSV